MKHRYVALFLSMIASTPVLAAPVVMVQFGSFETQQEAQKRLTDLKAANSSLFSTITPSVREVKLPPDNLTVYRTQAGPLESRAAAQSLCNKLATTGSECYVVETAVNTPATPVNAAVAKVAEKTTKAVEEKTPVAALAAPVAAAEDATSPELQTALNRAAAIQDAGEVSAPVAVAPTEKPSFWSRLNPFSSSTPKAPAPKPVVVAEKLPTSAPVVDVTSTSLAPAVAPTPAPAPITLASSDLRPRLLPPPAPLTEKDKHILETAPAPVAQHRAPVAPEALAAPIVAAEAPTFVPAPMNIASTSPASGSVQVEEAKRVPVTEVQQIPQHLRTPAVMVPPAVNPLPSATLGQKTLWAQVGQFNSADAALDFWENYRRQHPDFPALRVRVISPMKQMVNDNERVWLRVGPFGREGFIDSLCGSLAKTDKRCGQITDIGIAAKSTFTQSGYLQGSRYKR